MLHNVFQFFHAPDEARKLWEQVIFTFVIVLRVTLLTCARVCDLRCGCKREMNLQMCMRIHLAPQVIPAVKAGAIIVASPDLKEQVKI